MGSTKDGPKDEERRQIEESLRLLVENVRDYAIFMLDPTGHVKSWNVGAQRIKQYSASEIIGRHFSVFYLPEDAGKCAIELEGAKRDGRFEDEGWRVRRDGSRFWANVIITAVRDRNGHLIGFGKVTRDLSERIASENERLELARMQEADRRNQEFLAVMGHELRNPLAPMLTALRLMKLRGGQATEREITIMDRHLAHMIRLVDDLLDASRSLQGKMVLDTKAVEVGEALTAAIEMARPLIEARQHRLAVSMTSDDLTIKADVHRLAQVFSNLLNNAAKYTPTGGLIELSARAQDDEVIVSVKDNGLGIAPSLMPRIFDFFSQGEQEFERTLGGLGVGLALAQTLVKQHGGRLEGYSEGVGKGSTFTVRLPRVRALDVSRTLADVPVEPAGHARRVLIVDDNTDAAELLESYLIDRGHEIRTAHTGQQALKIVEGFWPHIVLMDIGLPGINGYELGRQLRLREGGQALKIIALSGYPRDLQKEQQVPLGFSAHLHKPVDLRQLESFFS